MGFYSTNFTAWKKHPFGGFVNCANSGIKIHMMLTVPLILLGILTAPGFLGVTPVAPGRLC